jgi:hypothetical protein
MYPREFVHPLDQAMDLAMDGNSGGVSSERAAAATMPANRASAASRAVATSSIGSEGPPVPGLLTLSEISTEDKLREPENAGNTACDWSSPEILFVEVVERQFLLIRAAMELLTMKCASCNGREPTLWECRRCIRTGYVWGPGVRLLTLRLVRQSNRRLAKLHGLTQPARPRCVSADRRRGRPNVDRHRDVPTVAAHLVFTLWAP